MAAARMWMASSSLLLVVVVVAILSNNAAEGVNQEGVVLLEAKRALTSSASGGGGALGDWNPRDGTPCRWTGVSCEDGAVVEISLPDANLSGSFPGGALCRLPRLRSVNLYMNYIGPELVLAAADSEGGGGGCGALQRLDLSMNALVGPVPAALADLPELRYLDLSSNNLSGPIPESLFLSGFRKLESLSLVYNLLDGHIPASLGGLSSNLRELNLSYNPFSPGGRIPPELGNLSSLRVLWLAGCNLAGPIPASLGRLANLTDLDLSMNSLTGPIPAEIATGLRSATQIELYNNSLTGPIPPGFGSLRELRSIDLSMNRLQGAVPEDLFRAPKLETVHLYANDLTGPLPESLARSRSLADLRLFANRLNGTLPAALGRNAPLVCVDVSDNAISGDIPAGICDRGELQELLMLDNRLTGEIPPSLGRCRSLRRVRLSNNRLAGDVPVWGLPHMSLLELNGNRLGGRISPAIAGAANLTKLVLSNNRFTGPIPYEIGSATRLYELSAEGNMLSGALPSSLAGLPELGRLVLRNNSLSGQLLRSWASRLSELNLADNALTGPIPPELGDLPVLNYLDLSGNRLTGQVPVELEKLKLNQLNVSDNQLSGPLPPQYAANPVAYRSSFLGNPELCRQTPALRCCDSDCSDSDAHYHHHQGKVMTVTLMIFVLAGVVLVGGTAWFYHRASSERKTRVDRSKWTLTSFHKLPFSEYEILDCLDEDKVIGSGASGKVYKAVLSSGEVVAVKKLIISASAGEGEGEDCFEAEVRTLGKIRHKNIVKLWCCCACAHHHHQDHEEDCRLLVYEYMPNGSLGDALKMLDWPTRLNVAVDAAEGLSYLHHDCVPPIVHRDVKSNNILLDAHLGARLADFGLAKILAETPKSMSVIAGSCGYIAPEYAYTLRVTEKSDTYSFGVVLLELVTGKPPVFGDKDLVNWVCATMDHKGPDAVIDPRLLDLHSQHQQHYREEITRVLHIALLCASSLPINRPAMRRVVKMLHETRRPLLLHTKLSPSYYHDNTASSHQSN